MLAVNFFSSSHFEDQEVPWLQKSFGVQTQQPLQEKDELRQILSPVMICMNKLYFTLVSPLTALKIIFLYV